MTHFDDWWETRKKEKHDYSLPTSVDMLARKKDRRDAALASLAFRAGMLAAADIAEMSKDYILPADDLADLIATQIRSYAKDG